MRPLPRHFAGGYPDEGQSLSSSSTGAEDASSRTSPQRSSSTSSYVSRPITPPSSSSNMAVSTAKASPQLRLPSFAELNQRLSYPDQRAPVSPYHEPVDERGSAPFAPRRQTVSSRPAKMHSHDDGYQRRVSDTYRPMAAEDVKPSYPSVPAPYQGPPSRQSPEIRRPSASGLTASWLPVDDPGRSSLRSGRVVGGAGGPVQARRATLSHAETSPKQPGGYNWYPQQPSPGWESAGPGPMTSASSSASSRYHPFARDGSISPDYPRPSASHSDYFAGANPVATAASSSTGSSPASSMSRRRGKLPKDVTELLRSWLMEHANHPYPNEDEKRRLCSLTGLSISQVSNWFINARRRILVPQLQTAAAEQQARAVAQHHHQHPQQHHHYAPPQHYHHHSEGTSPGSVTTPMGGGHAGGARTPSSHGSHGGLEQDDYFPQHRPYHHGSGGLGISSLTRQQPPQPQSQPQPQATRGPVYQHQQPQHHQQQQHQQPVAHPYYQHPDYATGRR